MWQFAPLDKYHTFLLHSATLHHDDYPEYLDQYLASYSAPDLKNAQKANHKQWDPRQ